MVDVNLVPGCEGGSLPLGEKQGGESAGRKGKKKGGKEREFALIFSEGHIL